MTSPRSSAPKVFAGNGLAEGRRNDTIQVHESWSARDLARVLEYLNFRNFQPVIEKAKEACAKSGYEVANHFADMRNMVGIGSAKAGE